MASRVDIANRALQKLGAARISSFDEGTRESEAVKAAYEAVRDAELQRNLWTFSIKRVTIAADSTTPAFGRNNRFLLPGDFLRTAPLDPFTASLPLDHLYEGSYILSNDAGPLNLRYVSRTVDEERYDPLFVDALAAKMAYELAEELTQSDSKKKTLASDYQFAVTQAKSINSIQSGPREPEIGEWVSTRFDGSYYNGYPYGYTT